MWNRFRLAMPCLHAPSLVALSVALGLGCNQPQPVQVVNQPPQISLEQPIANPSGDPIPLESGAGLTFQVAVADAEDASMALVVHWVAENTGQGGAVEELGDTTPDETGRSTKLISGLAAGRYQITARVEDTRGATDEVGLPIEVFTENLPPTVLATQPLVNAEFVEGDLITFVGTATDDRPVVDLDVEWFSDLDGLVSPPGMAPISSGLMTFSQDDLSVGYHTVTVRVTDSEGLFGETVVSFTVLSGNLPPTTPQIAINPPSPLTTDTLSCLILVGSADPEGNPIAYAYSWYRDGVPTLLGNATVAPEQTSAGEAWTCRVTASDGLLSSQPGEATATIGNQVPSITSATLGPSPAYETSALTCTGGGWSDGDGDPPGYQVAWLVDGVLLPGVGTDTLSGTWFDRDQTVQCELTPWDGFATGVTLPSNTVTIVNSAPTAPVVLVSPAPVADQDDDLTCTVDSDATDPDGDPFIYVVRWYVDGVYDATYDGQWTILAQETELGETWECSVAADDLADEGPAGAASVIVLPDPGDFVISEVMATPSAVSDPAGEWVELYNNSGSFMNLDGFELHDDGGDSHLINADLVVPPGARIVLARNGSYGTNGGVLTPYEYSGFALGDSTDQVVLSFNGVEIDRFNYDIALYSPSLEGHALSLNPSLGAPSPTLNDASSNWCGAMTPLTSPGSDFGTPGGANDDCACYFSDLDGDGYGTNASCAFIDCNDATGSFSPEANDICEDNIDQNCNGSDAVCPCLSTDNDGDGWGDGLACNPVDCNDSNPFIYPTAPELCNTIDENCNSVLNDGTPSVMCPPTNNVTVTACSSNNCVVTGCGSNYYDIDGQYYNGCECGNDGATSSCSGNSTALGNVANGQGVNYTGKLPTSSQSDWFTVTFSANGRGSGQGTPQIAFQTNPNGAYRFDVYDNCSSASCYARTSWSFADDQSPSYNVNNVPWPSQVWIRVYRVSGGSTCENYTLSIAR